MQLLDDETKNAIKFVYNPLVITVKIYWDKSFCKHLRLCMCLRARNALQAANSFFSAKPDRRVKDRLTTCIQDWLRSHSAQR